MELRTLLTMIFTVGMVWGGFLYILLKALKKEREKESIPERPSS
jgi:hypothetical protein